MNPQPEGLQPIQPKPAPSEPAKPSLASAGSSEQKTTFYSTPPGSSPATPPQETSKPITPLQKAAMGVVAAVVIGIGAWYGLANHHSSSSAPPAAAAQKQKSISLTRADVDASATEQLKAILSSGTAVAGGVEGLKAINGAALGQLAKTSPQMADEVKSGRRVLYRVYLLDFLQEDGDHVEMFVDGVSFGDIYLRNAGTSILIPLMAGTPAHIKLTATADGGGGVTVGFISSLGEARTDVLQVGQSEEWQVIVQ